MIQCPQATFIFDLDDTLYEERKYIRSGFKAVDNYMVSNGVEGFGNTLWSLFENGVRGNTFDLALEAHKAPLSSEFIKTLVDVYRMHSPRISLAVDAAKFLDYLDMMNAPYGIITDGPLMAQQAKIAALGLLGRAEIVICTDSYGRKFWKPHSRAFRNVQTHFGRTGKQLIYVGDNPKKDFKAPRELGWQTVRVRRIGGEHFCTEAASKDYSSDFEINFLDELITSIDRFGNLEIV